MTTNHTPTARERAATMLSAATALAAGTYIACGDGFTWDPTAYTIAWLLLICALAATIPQADTLIDTIACAIRLVVRILRHARHALHAAASRRHTTARATRGPATTAIHAK
ncbi:hypothetical protein [Bifidobacterium pseudolongum]|uniref:hypothetical protein n=1 Tax=Bifidobacterium pseudolongum TaxID=1694 RepID=UPI001021B459|nr:hypothetical protein [Bifidobacterium pseudolongum]RYQ67036.1 hypothetical protein PG2109B_1079 [Bifidobacterium pseudolongum subsp. globosum]